MENIKKNQNKYINPSLVLGTIKQSKGFLIIFASIVIGFVFFGLIVYTVLQNIKIPNDSMYQGILMLKQMNILQYYINDGAANSIIIGLVFTGIVAMAALLKDENKSTTEFLFAHPISRKKMFFTQMISFASILFLFSFVIMAISFILIITFNVFKFDFDVGQFFVYHLVLFIMNFIYGFFMYGLASIIKGKNYHAPAISIGIIIYLLSTIFKVLALALQSFVPWLDNFNYLFISNIMDILSFFAKGYITIVWQPILIWALAAIALNVWGYFRYQKKDLNCA